jgi:hypothetical protein
MARVIITRVLTYEYTDQIGGAIGELQKPLDVRVNEDMARWNVPAEGEVRKGVGMKITSTITRVEQVGDNQMTMEFGRGINPVDIMGSSKGYTVDTSRQTPEQAAIEDVCQPCQVGRCPIHKAPGRTFPSVGGHHQRAGMNDE